MKWLAFLLLTLASCFPQDVVVDHHEVSETLPDVRFPLDPRDPFPDMRSTNKVAHQFRRFISLFSFPEQYRPILELVNTLNFNPTDEQSLTQFLDELQPLAGQSARSYGYLFSAKKLPIWIDFTLISILLLMSSIDTAPHFEDIRAHGIEGFSKEVAWGILTHLGAPLILWGHATYRLLHDETLQQVSNYVMANHLTTVFKAASLHDVPVPLAKWFTFYSSLTPAKLVRRIKHGVFINDLGVALCVAGLAGR